MVVLPPITLNVRISEMFELAEFELSSRKHKTFLKQTLGT